MSAPADLAAYRAARDEPEPAENIWTLERHTTDPEGSPIMAEIAERLARLEHHVSALERRGRR